MATDDTFTYEMHLKANDSILQLQLISHPEVWTLLLWTQFRVAAICRLLAAQLAALLKRAEFHCQTASCLGTTYTSSFKVSYLFKNIWKKSARTAGCWAGYISLFWVSKLDMEMSPIKQTAFVSGRNCRLFLNDHPWTHQHQRAELHIFKAMELTTIFLVKLQKTRNILLLFKIKILPECLPSLYLTLRQQK